MAISSIGPGGTGVTLPSSKEQLFTLLEYADSQARSDLARKVLEVVEGELSYRMNRDGTTTNKSSIEFRIDLLTVLRELFAKEGIDATGRAATDS